MLEMPSENKQCQGRGNIGGQLIHAVDEKDFEVALMFSSMVQIWL